MKTNLESMKIEDREAALSQIAAIAADLKR
jgi:hypothetical protein